MGCHFEWEWPDTCLHAFECVCVPCMLLFFGKSAYVVAVYRVIFPQNFHAHNTKKNRRKKSVLLKLINAMTAKQRNEVHLLTCTNDAVWDHLQFQ